MKRKQTTCRCARYPFPHRQQWQCWDHIEAAAEREPEGRSEADRLYWADYHRRVRDLRSELA